MEKVKTKAVHLQNLEAMRIEEFDSKEALFKKMMGNRKRINLHGVGQTDWHDPCVLVQKGNKVTAVFIDSWFLEYQA